ncbi:MAG: P-loop NTPase [Clostridiales bacterium]|nr:P-loop NTPase [Clostridiales bacterium]
MSEIYVVVSGKGGVGKSSMTVLLGRALSKMGLKVLLMDCDIGLRSLDIILDVQDKVLFSWGDAAQDICELEQAVVEYDGLYLLAAPTSLPKGFCSADLRKIIDSCAEDFDYDYIFLDAGAGIADNALLAMGAADKALIVSTPDNVCVRSVAAAADKLFEIGMDAEDIRLIINRFDKKSAVSGKMLNVDDVIDSTGVRLIGAVPDDEEIELCLHRGLALPKGSEAFKAAMRIARRINGEEIKLRIK